MTTKREWFRKLRALKNEPRFLTPNECDELILLLGGTVRPNHRPPKTFCNMNRRHLNQGAIASIVFGFLENAEQVKQLENELHELESPDWLENQIKIASLAITRANAERIALEYKADEIDYLKSRIEFLRQWSAKNRSDAERMAVKWLESRNIQISLKKIQNELSNLRERAELKSLRLNDWKSLKFKEIKYIKKAIQQLLETVSTQKGKLS
ncbi:hypothetical protein [Nitrosomonas ureae]|uniref:Uncharacterized protein n=1 Tax=Nitrosomonas ureae TaxID=44577 RepID=A0A1H5SRN4_9PROT|nr:hypothetical protein [Nitrosomonas ureae]SEF53205.1 hypothetical protein SAMN05216334_10349 [Nitrosomonas ureae]